MGQDIDRLAEESPYNALKDASFVLCGGNNDDGRLVLAKGSEDAFAIFRLQFMKAAEGVVGTG
ncbi:hypothetical protein, partial [Enterobacter hormaechei]|uniref:hypothetical protein n=1 Tax=Enterobacter hormaechei TaxID=158836 RepID=UPI0019546CBA